MPCCASRPLMTAMKPTAEREEWTRSSIQAQVVSKGRPFLKACSRVVISEIPSFSWKVKRGEKGIAAYASGLREQKIYSEPFSSGCMVANRTFRFDSPSIRLPRKSKACMCELHGLRNYQIWVQLSFFPCLMDNFRAVIIARLFPRSLPAQHVPFD